MNFCEHTNGGKGFNVTCWFRRGIVSDEGAAVQGNTGQRNSNENMLDASNVSFHLTDIDVNKDSNGLPLYLDEFTINVNAMAPVNPDQANQELPDEELGSGDE